MIVCLTVISAYQQRRIKRLSDITVLKDRVGVRVRSLHAFAGVPKGWEGIVDEAYYDGRYHEGVMVRWDNPFLSRPLRDGFGRSGLMDEGELLEVIDAADQ